jgi:hypothetical protein
MSALALGGFGLAGQARAPAAPARVDPRGEARLALRLLAGAVACIYAFAGGTLIGRLPETAAVLLAGAALQAAWPLGLRRRPAAAVLAGGVLNAVLIVVWIRSAPITLLGVLCAADSIVLVVLGRAHRRASRWTPGLAQLAIVLAVASLAALAGGHTPRPAPASAGTPVPTHAFYCSLL